MSTATMQQTVPKPDLEWTGTRRHTRADVNEDAPRHLYAEIELLLKATPATAPIYLPSASLPEAWVRSSTRDSTTISTVDYPDLLSIETRTRGKPIWLTLAEIEHLPEIIRKAGLDWATITPATVDAAKAFILRFSRVVSTHSADWQAPHVASDGNGDVTFEWWQGDHSLTFFVCSGQPLTYLTAWGHHIWDEMDEAANPTQADLAEIWEWLQKGK